MIIEFFALPEKTFLDFYDAFVLDEEECKGARPPAFFEDLEKTGLDFDEWYHGAPLYERLSPDLPSLSFEQALRLLEGMEGKALFLSEPLKRTPLGGLTVKGRTFHDYVAMADPRELSAQILLQCKHPEAVCDELILPPDLYVFDPCFERLLVIVGSAPSPSGNGAPLCKAIGFEGLC